MVVYTFLFPTFEMSAFNNNNGSSNLTIAVPTIASAIVSHQGETVDSSTKQSDSNGIAMINLSVHQINHFFSCKLCKGYLIAPHCISECMHTFCLHCLIDYFDQCRLASRGSDLVCPTCRTVLGTYNSAISKLVFDRNIQSCIDKILDGSMTPVMREHKRKLESKTKEDYVLARSLYAHRSTSTTSAVSGGTRERNVHSDHPSALYLSNVEDVEFKVKLVPEINTSEESKLPPLPKPSFRAKFDVKLSKVQEFVYKRLEYEPKVNFTSNDIEILFDSRSLKGNDLKELRGIVRVTEETLVVLAYRKRV